ncbi:ectonucleoside triphosphate diphosphohydrolase 6-like [Oncorhynchus clarkii lewisi]|uniref:ectonucleoside triphosphate diphosphohydrolase 6-like n=1 Tax=Oncorhynchus clarkii lewisi TaxID=490388 RepID=UPI0039B96202
MGTCRSSVYCEGPRKQESPFESCLKKVEKLLFQKVKKAEEAKDFEFYAFSYYYDRAVDLGALDEKTGGTIKVSDYIDAAKSVCNGMTVIPRENPFLCLDLTYISRMLQGLGFPKEKVFKLARKIDEVETSWALGASFHYIESLHSQ